MEAIRIKGKTLKVDDQGFLVNPDEWDTDVASYFAAIEGIQMTEHHWEVVDFLRNYYRLHNAPPKVKVLIEGIGARLGSEKGNSKYLYQLYPCGPAVQACRIAGLPTARGCV